MTRGTFKLAVIISEIHLYQSALALFKATLTRHSSSVTLVQNKVLVPGTRGEFHKT